MKPDLKPLVIALRRKDPKAARERLERIVEKLDLDDEFWKGYSLALRGMVTALESGDELTIIRRIIDGKHSRENINRLVQDMQARISQVFRPKDEQGFNTAWMEVLQMFL
jgi:hypothetical protein